MVMKSLERRRNSPTVPTWAKAETRPVYTPEDVGAMAEGSATSVSTTELDELWNSL